MRMPIESFKSLEIDVVNGFKALWEQMLWMDVRTIWFPKC